MTGRILIVDAVPTNRIVLKVKMLAAQFAVDSCATNAEALKLIAENPPDLILINLADDTEGRHEMCRSLRSDPTTAGIAIISVGGADTAAARFAALDAGADDALPRPINDILLLARIRSLLRVRNTHQELIMQDTSGKALGFYDERQGFALQPYLTLLSPDGVSANLADMFGFGPHFRIERKDISAALAGNLNAAPDVFIIDGRRADTGARKLGQTVADLRSRIETRHSAILIIVPSLQPEEAALLLDLGADNAVCANISEPEINLRIKRLVRQKRRGDDLRKAVRSNMHAAVTDPLTGVFNRRYLAPQLTRIAEHSQKLQKQFAIIMFDIDHFKSINDTYGHATGDRVLIEVAQRLQENLRGVDILARIGGEEFLIVMPGTSQSQAQQAANRLRQNVTNQPFVTHTAGRMIRVTISAGVAVEMAPSDRSCDLEAVWQRADAALYKAKASGRDQIAIATDRPAA